MRGSVFTKCRCPKCHREQRTGFSTDPKNQYFKPICRYCGKGTLVPAEKLKLK
jgi:hypothetical protein